MSNEIHPVPVGAGHLAIGHRPGKNLLPTLHDHEISHVLTLLSANEGAPDLINRLEAAGFESLWLPLAGAKPIDDPDQLTQIRQLYHQLDTLLETGHNIFIHCSAGIHRTGMITNGYLRHRNITRDNAAQLLQQMRPHTRQGVTDTRLQWGEQFAPTPA